jgi:hypothetical protein
MRKAGSIPKPTIETGHSAEQRADVLAIASSHPTWIAQRWLQRFGEAEALELMACSNRCYCHALPELLKLPAISLTLQFHPSRKQACG